MRRKIVNELKAMLQSNKSITKDCSFTIITKNIDLESRQLGLSGFTPKSAQCTEISFISNVQLVHC